MCKGAVYVLCVVCVGVFGVRGESCGVACV